MSSESDIEAAAASLSVVAAMEKLVTTICKIHAMFVGLAILIPILLVIFMGVCSWIITTRLESKLNSVPIDVAKAMNINQSQTTIIKQPDKPEENTIDDMARKVLVRQGTL